jgi:signal transduction histidine kinase
VREISLFHPDVHWATTSDGTNPALPIPAADLLEVLLILLRNGAEAMNEAGKGSIEMRSTGSEFHVVLCDEGAGFSPEATSRIFEPGYTTTPEGSGYGLFLARRILEKHGGRLRRLSRGRGGAARRGQLPRQAGLIGRGERGGEGGTGGTGIPVLVGSRLPGDRRRQQGNRGARRPCDPSRLAPRCAGVRRPQLRSGAAPSSRL